MKKVLLTESQVRLITEEVDKNDSIQKLLFADMSAIQFQKVADMSAKSYSLIPVINGKKISDKQVKLTAEEIKVKDKTLYQLHIDVNYNIRRLGIAEKLFTAFILQGNPVCTMFSDMGESANIMKGLWKKLEQNPQISVKKMKYNGKEVGIMGIKK